MTYASDTPSPSLMVEFGGANGAIEQRIALVDTGAEWSVLPLHLGLRLGADPSLCLRTSNQTGGGDVDGLWWGESPAASVRPHPIVRVMGHEVELAPLLSPHAEVVILGRIDFLSSFKFAIDQREQTFTLEAYREPIADWLRRSGKRSPSDL